MFSVPHQESITVYAAIGICHTGFADSLLAAQDPLHMFRTGFLSIIKSLVLYTQQ